MLCSTYSERHFQKLYDSTLIACVILMKVDWPMSSYFTRLTAPSMLHNLPSRFACGQFEISAWTRHTWQPLAHFAMAAARPARIRCILFAIGSDSPLALSRSEGAGEPRARLFGAPGELLAFLFENIAPAGCKGRGQREFNASSKQASLKQLDIRWIKRSIQKTTCRWQLQRAWSTSQRRGGSGT